MAKAHTVDEVFEEIGSLGLYQILLLILLGYLTLFPGIQALLGTFTDAEPSWQCVPDNAECKLNGTFVVGDKNYDFRCHIPDSSWEFTKSFTSIVSEWHLVCSKHVLGTLPVSLVLLGSLPGTMLFGYIADRYGRAKSLILAMLSCCGFGLLGAFATHYWMYAAARFIAGMGMGGTSLVVITLPMEFTGIEHRGTVGLAVQVLWPFSLMLLGGLAYAFRHWRLLTVICSAPGLVIIVVSCIIPESPRWLLLQGRFQEAEKTFKRIASWNKTQMSPESAAVSSHYETRTKSNFLDLFKTVHLAVQTLILWLAWFSNALVYYGTALSASSLGGNGYLNFFLSSTVELPALFFGLWLINRFGRKRPIALGMIFAACFSAVCALAFPSTKTGTGITVGRVIFALLAKFCISPTFCSMFVYSSELIPTTVRNIGVGSCSAMARLGSFCAPYVLYMSSVSTSLPYGVMGILSLVAGLLCLLLQETHMEPTKEVLESLEDNSSSIEFELSTSQENSPLVNGVNNTSYNSLEKTPLDKITV